MATKAAASLRARMAVGTVATVVMGKLKTTRMMVMMVMTTFSQKGFLVKKEGGEKVVFDSF